MISKTVISIFTFPNGRSRFVLITETLITDYFLSASIRGSISLVSYLGKSASIRGSFLTDFGIRDSIFVM